MVNITLHKQMHSTVLAWCWAMSICAGLGGALCGVASAHGHTQAHDHSKKLESIKALFVKGALVTEPKLVNCKLSGGTKTTCFSVTFRTEPTGFKAGPWCPRHISDGPDRSGIWLHKGKVYNADGAFVKDLQSFYGDRRWQMYDPKTGIINVTKNKTACMAAARPDVDPKYRNHCVECETSYMPAGTTRTYVIPLRPVHHDRKPVPISRSGVGISFNGVKLEGSAPLHAILGAHTLAPFDDCGGHVNLHVGYHIHAVTNCLKSVASTKKHAPLIGIALDGYGIHARTETEGKKADDLDRCGGHRTTELGYHYHAAHPGENKILGCHVAETGCALESQSDPCDASTFGKIKTRINRWLNRR